MYSLVLGKSGPKMKEAADVVASKDDGDTAAPLPSQPKLDSEGFPILPPPAGGRGGYMVYGDYLDRTKAPTEN
jgi:hypothetical protein